MLKVFSRDIFHCMMALQQELSELNDQLHDCQVELLEAQQTEQDTEELVKTMQQLDHAVARKRAELEVEKLAQQLAR